MKLDKFNKDLIWNGGSFVLVAVIGVLINLIILNKYGSDFLGVFNQNYAIYILLSQLAVGGVHLSVQKYIPQFSHSSEICNVIVSSSIVLSVIFSIAIVGIGLVLNEVPGMILKSEGVRYSFKFVLPGLLFFSINKILLSYHNGYRRMSAFSVFTFLRFFFMLVYLLVLILLKIDPNYIAVILSLAEASLFVFVIIYSSKFFKFRFNHRFKYWFTTNFKFGNKALLGNLLLDINTRVDILLLGIFLSDAEVGLYSFAALIAEGLMQLPIMIRNNVNPVLTKCFAVKKPPVLERIISKMMRNFYKLIGLLGIVTIIFFPLALFVFNQMENIWILWGIYSVLALGIIISAGYIPFQMIFNQLGKPWIQTTFIFWFFIINVILNLIFIPLLGVMGAAIATSSTFIITTFIQRFLTFKYFNIKI